MVRKFVYNLRREVTNYKKRSTSTTRIACRGTRLVPLAGLEPARYRYRGILSPLCLPIPPQRHIIYHILISVFCQELFNKK